MEYIVYKINELILKSLEDDFRGFVLVITDNYSRKTISFLGIEIYNDDMNIGIVSLENFLIEKIDYILNKIHRMYRVFERKDFDRTY